MQLKLSLFQNPIYFMPKNLKTYFNGIAELLASQAKIAGVFSGKPDIGKCREIIAKNFLNKHLSARLPANIGGEIFGTTNQLSKQIDIIVNHDMCAGFKENTITRCPVESVTAAISVKSYLDKNQLYDALDNLASIPQLDPEVLTMGKFSKPFAEYVSSWPSLFVFAYDGISGEKLMEHALEFCQKNPGIPINRFPRAIITNKKYAITCIHYEDPKKLIGVKLTEDTSGSPLFWMICEITKGLSWLDGMYLSYMKYYGLAYP